MKTTAASLALTILIFSTIGSCGGDPSERGKSGVQVTPAARQEARQLFDSLCATCHGSEGRGDGPGAPKDPKPRSFADQQWQSSVSDEHIKTVITLGGAAVGKSAQMPAQPQLKSRPQVLEGLVQIVRGLGEQ